MNCPLCGYKYVCGCKSCNDNQVEDKILPRWITIGANAEACPICGTCLSIDHWSDLEMMQYRKEQQYKGLGNLKPRKSF